MMLFNALSKSIVIFSFFVMLTACVTESVDRTPKMRFDDAAIIAVQNPNAKIASNSKFAWLPEAMRFYDDGRLDTPELKTMINDEIVNNLKLKGMRFVDTPKQADFSIAYTAALESSMDDDEIIKRFGLLPGYSHETGAGIEKGSLIIYVFENRTNAIIWRSAAQVGVEFDRSAQERKQRVVRVMAEMFQTFPVELAAGKQ